jgi:WD40 repeat protein/serine/threonine protein kinase
MSEASSQSNVFDQLVEEFVARQRRGEHPSLTEYIARCPELADDIRELFPALALMEDVRPESANATEDTPRRRAADGPRPERLGDYRILREVGRGGMGVVYEAEQESLGRHVALKVLPATALLNPKHLQRFQREARAAARLHHTNIVPVYGVGEDNGLHYYVMQFIQGLGLDEVLVELKRARLAREGSSTGSPQGDRQATEKRGDDLSAVAVARSLLTGHFAAASTASAPAAAASSAQADTPANSFSDSAVHLPGQAEGSAMTDSGRAYWHSVARIGIQVADALSYAHAQGTWHRDIKPSNLLLDAHANVWVTDFGLARATSDADHLTHTGDVVGTLRYLPPERFSGKEDARGDVYSLGLTLYELLALRPAFADTDREQLVRRVMLGELPPLRKANPLVPRDLETIVLKATERDPGRRYASAAELTEDLKRFVDDRPIRARRIGPVERLWRWSRRNPIMAGLTATVAVLLVAVAIGASVFGLREERLRVEAEKSATSEKAARGELVRTLYFERIALIDHKLAADQRNQVDELLEQCPPEMRGWEWNYLKHWLQADPYIELRGHKEFITSVAFHPDGRRLASAGADSTIRIWDRTTGKQIRAPLYGHPGTVMKSAFTPNGRYLVSAGGDKTVKIWDAETFEVLHSLKGHEEFILGMALSPDSRLVASGGRDKTVRIWEVATGKLVHVCQGHDWFVRDVAFSTDSSRVVSLGGEGVVKIWDVATGQEKLSWREISPSMTEAVAISPDGEHLAVATGRDVHVRTLADGHEVCVLRGHFIQVFGLAYSHDGRRLATASWDNTAKIWDPESGREILTLRGHTDTTRGIAFSPDGRHLATASHDKTIRVWNATGETDGVGGLIRTVHTVSDHNQITLLLLAHSGMHPDGRRIAVPYIDGNVRVWDVGTAKEVGRFRVSESPAFQARFSPDGRRLTATDINGNGKIWDLTTRAQLWSGPSSKSLGPGYLSISADNRFLACGDQNSGAIIIRDLSSGRPLKSLNPVGQFTGMEFSPDSRLFAACGVRRKVTVWKTDGFEVLWTLDQPDIIVSLRFSPDGRRLVTGGNDRVARIWDLETGKEILNPPFREHKDRLTEVEFSSDGRAVASAAGAEALVWSAADGRVLRRYRGHAGMVLSARFTPDGKWLVTGGDDATLKVWDVALTPRDWHGPEARKLVDQRFAKLLLRADVVESLRTDKAIPAEVLPVVLQLAEEHDEDPQLLDAASGAVVKDRGGDPTAYRLALRRAETACRLWPNNGEYLNTLGLAYYRIGKYKEAGEALRQGEPHNTFRMKGPWGRDLGLRAFLQLQEGRIDEARATVAQLREVIKNFTGTPTVSMPLLRELEGLLAQKDGAEAKNPKP